MAGGMSRGPKGRPSGCQRERRRRHMEGKQLIAPRGCLWPTSYYTSCGATPTQGRLCTHHLSQVLAHVGGWRCAWPGCQRLSSASRGLCTFHVAVATGEAERGHGRPLDGSIVGESHERSGLGARGHYRVRGMDSATLLDCQALGVGRPPRLLAAAVTSAPPDRRARGGNADPRGRGTVAAPSPTRCHRLWIGCWALLDGGDAGSHDRNTALIVSSYRARREAAGLPPCAQASP
jgi:hypothetical protein